jgi:Protein of unknown function (DUF3300)
MFCGPKEEVRSLSFAHIVVALALIVFSGFSSSPGHAADSERNYSPEKIEQLVAPIALHPDALLSQILMAATYPLEVVEAARWSKENPKVTGDALNDAMADKSWDASVKSLTTFPQVLAMMNEDLAWLQQLGDAFLAQQKDVLDAAQRLRKKADEAGNLNSTKEQVVEKQEVENDAGTKETIIIVEQADPTVIYVPAYNPTVVYGVWPYPTYPPYYYRPPGYAARGLFWFSAGVIVGNSLWGRCRWGRGDVNINVNRYNNFNRTNINNNRWNHNPNHRKGVPYKNRDVAKRYNNSNQNRKVQQREQYRGRADAGRSNLKSYDAKKNNLTKVNKSTNATNRKSGNRAKTQRPSGSNRAAAYQGVGNGHQVRKQSARGHRSQQISSSRRSGGNRGGGRRR